MIDKKNSNIIVNNNETQIGTGLALGKNSSKLLKSQSLQKLTMSKRSFSEDVNLGQIHSARIKDETNYNNSLVYDNKNQSMMQNTNTHIKSNPNTKS